MPNIQLKLTPASCYHAKQKLDAYARRENSRLDMVCKRLAEEGAREAKLHLGVTWGGNDDAHVSVEKTENGYKVVLSGQDIYFVEFGTGMFAGSYPNNANVSVGIMPGDYSETHAKQYSTKGYWFYDNVFYRGTPAEMPMYWAGKRMREVMPRVIQEVYGK